MLPLVGFSNQGSDMNCFLNACLQAVCNLTSLRESVLRWEPPCRRCMTCVSCLTLDILEQYRHLTSLQGGTIQVGCLRRELARVYESKRMFQLCAFADSTEALQALLQAVHSNAVGDATQGIDSRASDNKCSPCCPAHQIFNIQVREKLVCACGQEGPVTDWDRCTFFMTYYVQDLQGHSVQSTLGRLGEGLKLSMVSRSPLERCVDEDCDQKQCFRHTQLCSSPRVFGVNLVWAKATPSLLEILSVLASLPENLACFEGDSHHLRGFILYKASHYLSIFHLSDAWFLFDDEVVLKLPNLLQVVKVCLRRRLHPVLVFYEQLSNPPPLQGISQQDWLLLEAKVVSSQSMMQSVTIEGSTYLIKPKQAVLKLAPCIHSQPQTSCPLCKQLSSLASTKLPILPKPQSQGASCAYCQRSFANFSRLCPGCGNLYLCKTCKTDLLPICMPCFNKCWKCSCNHTNKPADLACSKCSAPKKPSSPPPPAKPMSTKLQPKPMKSAKLQPKPKLPKKRKKR
jgi:hypothetical protein